MIVIPVQVNGRLRSAIRVKVQEAKVKSGVEKLARKAAAKWLKGKKVKRVVWVEGKLVNFVVE